MKVDLREISRQRDISYSDALWEYVLEDFLWRINSGEAGDILWLKKPDFAASEKLSLYYIDDQTSKNPDLDEILKGCILENAELDDHSDVKWSQGRISGVAQVIETSDDVAAAQGVAEHSNIGTSNTACSTHTWALTAECDGIEVPFAVKIDRLSEENAGIPAKKEIQAMNRFHGVVTAKVYSQESILGEQIFEMMEKLELVSDMRPFAVAYTVLRDNSISGRHIVDIFKQKAEEKPRVVSMRRLEQIKGYRNYAYMKKRWIQYCKRNGIEAGWEEALDLILAFLEPVWSAFCNNEIFFDDWMPELGRFLG